MSSTPSAVVVKPNPLASPHVWRRRRRDRPGAGRVSRLVLCVNIAASQRDYRNDIVITSGDKRRDTIVSPGVSLTFSNLFAIQTDLRLDYRYLMDHSNDPTKSFNDHIVTASVIARFDPT